MAEDRPKYNPTFEDEVKSAVVGEKNIVYNYFYYREDVRGKPVESEETAAEEKLPCPYRGLFHFGPDDAEVFFGREVFVEELFAATQTLNFITVLGASGSGKSSVVLAGLVPKLQQAGHWLFTHFRPGSDPFHALALALVPLYTPDLNATERIAQARQLAGYFCEGTVPLADVFAQIHQNHPTERVLLIADQFEELYTLCGDQKIRRSFLDTLLASFQSSPSQSQSPNVLVATMRVDFLGNALSYPPFGDLLRYADVKIRSMNHSELEQVIVKPAQKLGVTFQEGLVERILDDVEDEPGNLPLLEFALTELWKRRTGKQLTHAAYEAIGEVQGALARHADESYGKLSLVEQQQVHHIFIQLVRPGEGTEDTRRLAIKAELGEESWGLIKKLADARLVVTSRNPADQETVEVVHEALIRNWGELRQWMETDRSFRVWQEQLRVVLHQWENAKHDEGALLRGLLLLEAEEWQKKRGEELSQAERNFIRQSSAFRDKEKKKEKRRQLQIISWLTGGLIVALGLTGLALRQWQKALIEEINTITASVETYLVSNQEFEALMASLRAGKKAQNTFGVDFETRIQVISALQNSFYRVREFNRFSGHQDLVWDVSFSPDGQIIASASYDNTIKLWNLKGELLQTFTGHRDHVDTVSFSPNVQMIASSSNDHIVKLWNLKGELLQTFAGHEASVSSVSFSPDGQMIASGSADHTVKLWNLKGELLQTFAGHEFPVSSVSFSPNGQMIASGSNDHTVKLWNLKGELLQTFAGHEAMVSSVSFSPDGQMIASGSGDNTVKLWNLKGELDQTLTGHEAMVSSVSFSPDGQIIASASSDNTVKLWNLKKPLLLFLQTNIVDGNNFSLNPNGEMIVSVSKGDKIKLWNLKGELLQTLRGHTSKVIDIGFSPDGQIIVSVSYDNTVKLWNLQGELLQILEDYRVPNLSRKKRYELASDGTSLSLWKLLNLINKKTFSFSADSKTIAFVSNNNTIKIWNLEQEKLITTLVGHTGTLRSISFSADGQNIISVGYDNKVKLWSLNGKLLITLKGYNAGFSPDGNIIASANNDGTIKLWNLNGEQITTIEGDKFFFSPDGKVIASAKNNKTIKLWNLNGEPIAELRGHANFVNSVSFSPNGQLIASGSDDNTIKLWNLKGKLLQTLIGHKDSVNSVSFNSDGKTLVSSSIDQTIKLWSLDIDRLMIRGCDWVRDYIENNSNIIESDKHICKGNETEPSKVNQEDKSIEKNEAKEEIAAFSRVIELKPNSFDAYISRSQAYFFLEDYNKALDDLNQAIKLKPKTAYIYGYRGTIYHKLKDYPKALADYNQALAIDNKLLLVLNNIGLINYEIGDKEEAFEQWREAIIINANKLELLQQEYQELLQQKTKEGKDMLYQAVQISNIEKEEFRLIIESAEPLLAFAVVLYTEGEQEEGLEFAELALRQEKRLANVEFLKDNLWGEKLLADTQKLLETERIKAFMSSNPTVLEK